MNVKLYTAFASLWLLCTVSLSAQSVGIHLPILNNVTPGATVFQLIKVTDFDSVASMQFVIRWNPAVLKFQSVNGFNLPDLTQGDFNTMNTLDSGFVRVSWEGPSVQSAPAGTTVADSTVIFRIKFEVLGPLNSGSQVYVTQVPPTDFEITKVTPNNGLYAITFSQANLTMGFVAVGYTYTSTVEQGYGKVGLKMSPNPFSEKASVSYTLNDASDVYLVITDASGRLIYERTIPRQSAGEHTAEFEKAQFRESGQYYLIIRTAHESGVLPFFNF
jgi:hypothetical protein